MAVESGGKGVNLAQSQKYSDLARFKSRTEKKHEVRTEQVGPASDYSASFRRDSLKMGKPINT